MVRVVGGGAGSSESGGNTGTEWPGFGSSGDDPLGDAIADYIDGYLDQAAANAEAVEDFLDDLGDAIADYAESTENPTLAGLGAAVDSLLDDLGEAAGGPPTRSAVPSQSMTWPKKSMKTPAAGWTGCKLSPRT